MRNLRLDKTKLLAVFLTAIFLFNTSSVRGKVKTKGLSSKTLKSMSRSYMAYKLFSKARPYAEAALKQAGNEGNQKQRAICNIDLAMIYQNLDMYEKAEKAYKKGIGMQKKALYQDHPYVAYSMRELSSLYFEQGLYAEAEDILNKSIKIMLKSHDEKSKTLIPFKLKKTKILAASGKKEKSKNCLKKLILEINTNYNSKHLYTATLLSDVSECQLLLGDINRAETHIDKVIAIRENICGKKSHLNASAIMAKAEINRLKGNHAMTDKLIDRALKLASVADDVSVIKKIKDDARKIRSGRTLAAKLQ